MARCYTHYRGTVYAWPSSPTWPQATSHTNTLLETVVKELGLSRAGPRFIAGDLNHPLEHLPAVQMLFQLGCVDLQTYAFEHLGRPFSMTCKGATITDYVLLCPE